jgi:hypothetical protein
VEGGGVLRGEPVLAEVICGVSFLAELVELCEDGGGQHLFDVDPACPFGVEEEEEFADGCSNVVELVGFLHVLEVDEGGDEFGDVLCEVLFGEVAVAGGVVETDVYACLEEVVFPDDGVEEGLHVDASVLIAVEFEEGGGAEEMSEFEVEVGGDGQEGVVVESFLVVVGRREVIAQQLMQSLQI